MQFELVREHPERIGIYVQKRGVSVRAYIQLGDSYAVVFHEPAAMPCFRRRRAVYPSGPVDFFQRPAASGLQLLPDDLRYFSGQNRGSSQSLFRRLSHPMLIRFMHPRVKLDQERLPQVATCLRMLQSKPLDDAACLRGLFGVAPHHRTQLFCINATARVRSKCSTRKVKYSTAR